MTDKENLKDIKASVVMDFGDKTFAILMGEKSICVERAKLIAAAPDLLDALIELRKLVTHHDQADAAINKALGG